MSKEFARRISVSIKDVNGDPVRGAVVTWYVNGTASGTGKVDTGTSSMEVSDEDAVVSVQATYEGSEIPPGIVKLAQDQQSYEFVLDIELHPRSKEFLMKHFPGVVGIVFMLLGVVLVFAFKNPTPAQLHIIYAMFALGGGGFGGELAGSLNVTLNLGTKLAISAGGALAIFVLLYFFAPAGSPSVESSPNDTAPQAAAVDTAGKGRAR